MAGEVGTYQTTPGTYAAQNIVQNFFRKIPSDRRFSGYQWEQYLPIGAFPEAKEPQNDIEFNIPPALAPHCYMIQNMLVEVDLLLCFHDGTSI